MPWHPRNLVKTRYALFNHLNSFTPPWIGGQINYPNDLFITADQDLRSSIHAVCFKK